MPCSYSCHEGHNLVELYTRRNFRCDCGTNKMSAVRCTLDPLKFEPNDKNIYNQNYSGVYCICHRPYPDPEDLTDDEMIQCSICEDWFHCRHLGCKVPRGNKFAEMICGGCMANNSFLEFYIGLCVTYGNAMQHGNDPIAGCSKDDTDEDNNISINDSNVSTDVNTTQELSNISNADNVNSNNEVQAQNTSINNPQAVEEETLTNEINQCLKDIMEISNNNDIADNNESAICSNNNISFTNNENTIEDDINNLQPLNKKRKLNEIDDDEAKSNVDCKRPLNKIQHKIGTASFWPLNWRKHLCKCTFCYTIYENLNVTFLTDLEDTVLSYEEKGLAKARETNYDHGINKALSKLNHTTKIDVITGYNRLKDKLKEFLNPFVVNNITVTEDDINRFFTMMKGKK